MSEAAVVNMKGKPTDPSKTKKERECILCIEDDPRPEWFVQCKGPDGKILWFLRLSVKTAIQ